MVRARVRDIRAIRVRAIRVNPNPNRPSPKILWEVINRKVPENLHEQGKLSPSGVNQRLCVAC